MDTGDGMYGLSVGFGGAAGHKARITGQEGESFMATYCNRCVNDEDLASFSLFFLKHKRDLHPSFTTMDTVTLLCMYMTEGHLLQITDDDNRTIAIGAYYHGTRERQFQDKEVALIDMVIFDAAYRGSRLFIKGFRYMVNKIAQMHPEVEELRLAALAENDYLCKLYAKFTESRFEQEGGIGKEVVFGVKINKLKGVLNNFGSV